MDKSKAITSAREIDNLFFALTEDVKQAAALWAANQDDFSKRIYIKTCFSLVEGVIQVMKSSCLFTNEYNQLGLLTPEEIVLLKEELAYVKQNGKVGIKNTPISLEANFCFAMQCSDRVFNLKRTINTGGDGWEAFKKAIKIRDRITHPHKSTDLNISEEDMATVNVAMDFFREETIPFVQCVKA